MRMPRLLLIILLGLIALPCPGSSSTQGEARSETPQSNSHGPPSHYQQYEQAKFYFNQLETNPTLTRSRENWLKGTRNFRRIYLANPKAEQAPASLFMLGRMYRKMYEKFSLGIDLDESLSYFKDTSRLFPGHFLADDALYAEGLIYLQIKRNPKNAAEAFEQVVTRYANGDMHAKAADSLKVLSKDYDIPLPAALVGSTQLDQLVTVHPVKYWSSQDYTRVVVMAAAPITYKEILLKEQAGHPRRLYIDFKSSYISPEHRKQVPVEDGLLKKIRTDQTSADTVRVVLDIGSIDTYKIFSLPDPFRVVIDVRGERKPTAIVTKKVEISEPSISSETETKSSSTTASVSETAGGAGPHPTSIVILKTQKKRVFQHNNEAARKETVAETHQTLSLIRQLGLGVKKIVLDPGHGGKDPGAMANSMQEKDIVLKIAKQLGPILKRELNCDVILTRNTDIFLPLEERTAIANTEEADLFISLHVNAHPSPKTRGTETYFLNLSTNAEAMRVAAMENATSTHQMSDLEDILSDILKNSKIDESSRLARQVQNSILTGLAGKTFGDIKNLGVKQAPFYVLIGAQMPAILIEIAFISNKDDADNLKNPLFIESVTREIAQGIKAYVQTNTASLY
jgi:N-acetylmuramoyl-L-alanine amidase